MHVCVDSLSCRSELTAQACALPSSRMRNDMPAMLTRLIGCGGKEACMQNGLLLRRSSRALDAHALGRNHALMPSLTCLRPLDSACCLYFAQVTTEAAAVDERKQARP